MFDGLDWLDTDQAADTYFNSAPPSIADEVILAVMDRF
jgi:hypothetical protein